MIPGVRGGGEAARLLRALRALPAGAGRASLRRMRGSAGPRRVAGWVLAGGAALLAGAVFLGVLWPGAKETPRAAPVLERAAAPSPTAAELVAARTAAEAPAAASPAAASERAPDAPERA